MRASDFDYQLPPDRIAQTPVEPRDSARLMVVRRADGVITDSVFHDIGRFLRPGDLLVANDSRVIPARLHGVKAGTGGAVEVLLLRPAADGTWETLVRGTVRRGTCIEFPLPGGGRSIAEVVELGPGGTRRLRFDGSVERVMTAAGQVPLPPYITTPLADAERYQTVYARAAGSAAAPTAGLHFTDTLMATLRAQGVAFAFVTLHVGLDTFQPLAVEDIHAHAIHREWAILGATTADAVSATRDAGGRVIAVGTTAVRVLETAAQQSGPGDPLQPFAGWTDLYITPGYTFRQIDGLVTNFHLPRSTLLLLVAAFMGKPLLDHVYAVAIRTEYRFYSFGDATLLL